MEEKHADVVLLARTIESENPAVENASFFFEYRLVLPDDELVSHWLRIYIRARVNWTLYGEVSCALQRRRVDTFPAGPQQGEWVYRQFAKTIWQLLWDATELRNSDIQSCHPIHAFARDAYMRVSEIDQALSKLTERGLREDFEERFQKNIRRLRNQQRIAAIRRTLLQEYNEEHANRLEPRSILQAERERLIQGVDAPQLVLGRRVIPIASKEQ